MPGVLHLCNITRVRDKKGLKKLVISSKNRISIVENQ